MPLEMHAELQEEMLRSLVNPGSCDHSRLIANEFVQRFVAAAALTPLLLIVPVGFVKFLSYSDIKPDSRHKT